MSLEGQSLDLADDATLSPALAVLAIEIWGYMLQFMTPNTLQSFSIVVQIISKIMILKSIYLDVDSLKSFESGSLIGCRG